MPTEKCNFRCVYCYEDFKLGKMSEETISGIKNLIEKSAPKLKTLVISWFGGEPTLNPAAIKSISTHILALQKQYNFRYSGGITTNAYLVGQAMFEEFLNYGITHYQITLDGMPEQHDKTRILANGDGSFEVLWKNITSYQEIDKEFSITIRLHITKQNVVSMYELSKKISAQFDSDQRYKVLIKKLENLGTGVAGNPDDYIPTSSEKIFEKINAIVGETKVKNLNSDHNPYICYAAMPRHLTIRSDGRLAKCTVMFNDVRNDVGKINADGSIEVDGKKMDLWTRGFADFSTKAMACPASGLPKLQSNQ